MSHVNIKVMGKSHLKALLIFHIWIVWLNHSWDLILSRYHVRLFHKFLHNIVKYRVTGNVVPPLSLPQLRKNKARKHEVEAAEFRAYSFFFGGEKPLTCQHYSVEWFCHTLSQITATLWGSSLRESEENLPSPCLFVAWHKLIAFPSSHMILLFQPFFPPFIKWWLLNLFILIIITSDTRLHFCSQMCLRESASKKEFLLRKQTYCNVQSLLL